MYVTNSVTHDSRVLREAATLRDAGWKVTIVGRLTSGSPAGARHEIHHDIDIIRVTQPIRWRDTWRPRMSLLRSPWRARGMIAASMRRDAGRGGRGWSSIGGRVVGIIASMPWLGYRAVDHFFLGDRLPAPRREGAIEWLLWWRWSALGWAEAAVEASPPAVVYHGHDLTGLAAAALAGRTHGGKVVYDSHEIYLDSRSNARRPRWARSIVGAVERRWARQADALVTVNDAYAGVLSDRVGRDGFVVVHNCPPRWTPPSDGGPDRLRVAAHIGPDERLVLYHGLFGHDRGIEQLTEAMLEPGLAAAHLVLLGYGPLEDTLRARAAERRFGGRIHVLDAVPPDELLDWISTADVDAIPLQPTTLNHRLCTPNKLFESIAAGVPVVVSDFPVMRRIVLGDPDGPLGAVCDPARPASIALAIRSIIERPDDERDRLRARCLRAAARAGTGRRSRSGSCRCTRTWPFR